METGEEIQAHRKALDGAVAVALGAGMPLEYEKNSEFCSTGASIYSGER